MKKEINKKKYLLKGEYYEAFERVSFDLKSNSIGDEVLIDILDMFYRNQEAKKSVERVIGSDYNKFIKDVVGAYYSNYDYRNWILKGIKTCAYLGIFTIIFSYIDIAMLGIKTELESIIFLGLIFGWLIGAFTIIINYNLVFIKNKLIRNLCKISTAMIIAIYSINIDSIYLYFRNLKFIEYVAVPLLFIDLILCVIFIINNIKNRKES